MSSVKAAFKFFLFVILCLIVVPAQSIVLLLHKGRGAYILTHFWQKCVCTIFNIKVEVSGTPYTSTQTIYFANHISYLDIPVIGSIIRASFVAKKDVASWPVFGFLSTLQQTAFISRDREDAEKEKNALDNMLDIGKSLIIFPEGTSTDGREVIPFKSSLFSIAMKKNLKDIYVQPVTLKMMLVDGQNVTNQNVRDIYSWHINMDTPLGTHLWRFAQSKGAVISVIFHPEIKAHSHESRKTLAKACYNAVSNGLENTI